MARILLIAVLIYGFGDPGFDGHRPAALDRPLRSFHRAVDTAASDAQRAVIAIKSGAHAIPKLQALGETLRRVGEGLVPG
jgi:hypothetical protein